MAKRMAKLHQGADNETILPVNRGRVKEKDQNYSKRYSDADRTRKDKGLPSPFQDKGQRTMCLSTRRSAIDNFLYDCSLLEAQRGILRKNVTIKGQWPADKHELITNHLEPFLTYIESIDFNSI